MKIKNSIKMIALSVVASTLFVGCGGSGSGGSGSGGSGSGSSDDITALTGTFVDAPVQGLGFKTPSQSGFTDASGNFKYLAGEEIEFTLGNLSLGKGTVGALITPYTIADNNDTATNIALMLQNFDGNRSDNGVLDLSKLKDYNFTSSDFNLSATTATVEAKIDILFADNSFSSFRDTTNNNVIDATTVKSNMDTYINTNSINFDKKFTQAYLDNTDFYATDDLGPLIMRFDNGQLYYAGDSYEDDNGQVVQGAGWNGIFDIDGSGVAEYTLENGVISIVYGGGSFIVTTKIIEITNDYVKVFQQRTDGETQTLKWYTSKEA